MQHKATVKNVGLELVSELTKRHVNTNNSTAGTDKRLASMLTGDLWCFSG